MKQFLCSISAVCIMAFSVAPAGALEIFYPADKTYVARANYLIVKGGEPQLEAMVLAFNGLRSAPINVGDTNYRKVFKDILIIPAPPFEEGGNEIVVEGYVGGKLVRSAQASIYYRPDRTEPAPEGYRPFVMHLPDREAKCAGCHQMKTDVPQMSISDPNENPCYSCHKGMLKKKYVHGPVGSISCGDCHVIATAGAKYPVPKKNAELCNECHEDKTEEYKLSKFVHGPVAAGLCQTCHDPHGSDVSAQLISPVERLCHDCHESSAVDHHVITNHPFGMEPLKDPSRPGRDLECISCHNPHSGAHSYFFVDGISSSFSLCSRCHKK